MTDTLSPGWNRTFDFVSVHHGYTVSAIRFVSPSHQIGWQIACWPDEHGTVTTLWVEPPNFYEFAVHPLPSRKIHHSIEILNEPVIVPQSISKAVLAAIKQSEGRSENR